VYAERADIVGLAVGSAGWYSCKAATAVVDVGRAVRNATPERAGVRTGRWGHSGGHVGDMAGTVTGK